MLKKTAIVIAVLFVAGVASAEIPWLSADSLNLKGENDQFALGAAAAITQRPYKGMEAEFEVIPLIDLVAGNFYFRGKGFGYEVYGDCFWTVALVGEIRPSVYEDDDDNYLDGMRDRDMTLDGGVSVNMDFEAFDASVTYLTDLFSKHQGQEVRLTLSRVERCGDLVLRPSVGVSYFNSNFTDYYYGVRSKEARANRPVFDCGDAVNWFASISANYQLNCNWSLFGAFSYEWLPSEITKSPVVNRDYSTSIMAGLLYKF